MERQRHTHTQKKKKNSCGIDSSLHCVSHLYVLRHKNKTTTKHTKLHTRLKKKKEVKRRAIYKAKKSKRIDMTLLHLIKWEIRRKKKKARGISNVERKGLKAEMVWKQGKEVHICIKRADSVITSLYCEAGEGKKGVSWEGRMQKKKKERPQRHFVDVAAYM